MNGTAGTTVAGDAQTLVNIAQGIRDFYSFGYGERPYKANLSGRYAFTNGRIKGAFVGGGVRWQGESKLGRIVTGRDALGNRTFGNVIYGPEDFKMDMFFGYRRKVSIRSHKADLTFQVNITNLTDEDEYMPLRYNPLLSGYARVLLLEPRKVRLTVGLAF